VSDLAGRQQPTDAQGSGGRRDGYSPACGFADPTLRASAEQLQDALSAAATLSPLHREILGLFLARLQLIESQMQILVKSIAQALQEHEDAVKGLAEPGYGVDSAHQVIAEV
jgi:hypothetical protein